MGQNKQTISDVLLRISIIKYTVFTASLPAFALVYCLLTAILFRIDEVNDTDCNVTNSIPSVSAVTGIRPQVYVWRLCVGLHSTPRFLVGAMYYNQYKNFMSAIPEKYHKLYSVLVKLNFVLYTVECFCLLAVSVISNKENYPVHEKIFIVFMTTSIAYQLLNTILYKWSRHHREMTLLEKKSYRWKKVMTAWICLSTIGLLIFFVRHRFYCIPGAFSIFSMFEYMIAYANIGHHVTGYWDFHDKALLMCTENPPLSNGLLTNDTEPQQKLTVCQTDTKKVQ